MGSETQEERNRRLEERYRLAFLLERQSNYLNKRWHPQCTIIRILHDQQKIVIIMQLDQIKYEYKETMSHFFPNGIQDNEMWKNTIKVFLMGWCYGRGPASVEEDVQLFSNLYLIDPLWFPDDSWRYWKDKPTGYPNCIEDLLKKKPH